MIDNIVIEGFILLYMGSSKKIEPGKLNYSKDTAVLKCSGKDNVDDWYDSVYDFITSLKSKDVIKDYNQVHQRSF